MDGETVRTRFWADTNHHSSIEFNRPTPSPWAQNQADEGNLARESEAHTWDLVYTKEVCSLQEKYTAEMTAVLQPVEQFFWGGLYLVVGVGMVCYTC